MGTVNYNIDLSGEWKFILGNLPKKEKLTNNDYHLMAEAGGAHYEYDIDNTPWETVTVPHDWLTYLPYDKSESAMNGYKARGEGWYFKRITLPEEKIESAKITFDGILGISTVYVNGIVAARNFSGYNRFSAEIGDYLLPGKENDFLIHVDAKRGEGWFYEGAGFYRSARLSVRDFSHIDEDFFFARAEETEGVWQLVCDAVISGEDNTALILDAALFDQSNTKIAGGVFPAKKELFFTLPCKDVSLWSPDSPTLYRLVCELKRDSEIIDKIAVNVGFRKLEFTSEKKMTLNGESFRIKGICCHQDHAGVGAAVTREINEYRIRKLKELSVNAYRTAHNAPDEQLLDICDRLGMLVMVENRTFSASEDAMRELDALVRLSRNHPSVFLYSLFNEEPWQNDERGYRIAKKMRERISALDPTRKVTAAQNSGILEKNNASDALDIIGVNYNLKNYEQCHKRSPDKLILGTENCPTFATRGVYETDRESSRFSSYGDDYADWFSESLDETMEAVERYPFVIGCFAWCGFEHRGEPVPCAWPSVTSHWGFCDLCGFEKDTAYLLKAYYSDELTVHLIPKRSFKVGELVRAVAFTNADEAELFMDGKSLGKVIPKRRRAEWDIVYEGGALTVKAYKESDVKCDSVLPAYAPDDIIVTTQMPDTDSPTSRVLNVKIVDDKETLVYNFCENIEISISNGKILGVGNGNPTSRHDEHASSVYAFMGRAQIIISSEVREITLRSSGISKTYCF